MRRSKLFFLITLLIMTVSLVGYILSVMLSRGDRMTELRLMLSLDKAEYRSGDSIHASIILKNTGNQDIVVRKRMVPGPPYTPKEAKEVVFVINGPSGEINPPFRIQASPLTPDDFILLSPGETVVNTFDIQKIYHLTEIGTYSISVVYQNMMNPGSFHKEAWKGEITSNVVSFEIIP